MERRELICIGCPMGCPMIVGIDKTEIQVSGNTCPRGDDYARKEVLSPTRIVTSSVKIEGGVMPMVSVKTEHDIPKGKIMDIMNEIHQARVKAPIAIGDVVIGNCADTGVNIVATRNVEAS